MSDLEDDIFQAHCQIDSLASLFDERATIRHCRDDVVTLDLRVIVGTLALALFQNTRLKGLLADMCDAFEEHVALPDANCSCHINPPCGDCTGYSFARDVLAAARAALAGETDQ